MPKAARTRTPETARAPALRTAPAEELPFWKAKTLEQMTAAEWESLCDGCGRCCLNKLVEEGSDKTLFTDVACKLLDHDTCRCKDYANRLAQVEDCVLLTPETLREITWLPPTCAYVLLAKGRDLYWWHPLVSGDPDSVHAAGISVKGRVGACETQVPDEELEKWIVGWPGRVPKGAKGAVPHAKERAKATPAAVRPASKAQTG
jgi:uncharacterized cysteine cluster protein YcgN (CxxCxxCC family)